MSFGNTSNVLRSRLVSATKQNVSIDLGEKILVRASNKIAGPDLAPFSEMVVNHCCKSKKK